MTNHLSPPLQTRRGPVLRVLSIERISTEHQDLQALDDQRAKSKRWVNDRYEGEIEWKNIASRSSGEVTDRESYREMEDVIDSGWPDLVVVEDLGRICRRIDALRICERCEDFGTRVIAVGDHVDTFHPEWKMAAMFSTLHQYQLKVDSQPTTRSFFLNGCRAARNFSGVLVLKFLCSRFVPPWSTTQTCIEVACRSIPQ